MQLFDFVKPLLKWWWLIVLSTAIATGVSYWISKPLPPVYLSHTTLMVGRAISDPNPTGNEFGMAQQLAIYYVSIAMREPVYEATQNALGLDELPEYIAQAVPNSPFIEIIVTDTDPNRAMIVANELAQQVILQSPTAPQKEDIEQQQFIKGQLTQIQQSIVDTQKEIEDKRLALTQLSSATEIQDTQAEIIALESKLILLQNNYADLIVNTGSGAINTISIVEIASVPTLPIGPKKYLIIGLAAIAGMALAVGIAYLIEFLDRTIKTPEEVERFFQSPVLGYIHKFSKNEIPTSYIIEPRSPAAEAFRTLRTNIGFASVGKPLRTLVITSTHQGEGKTTIAINLAVSMAQADKKVRLVDADLRRPHVHQKLNIPIEPGLSDAFQENEIPINRLTSPSPLNANLSILPSGKQPPNPAELINSAKMDQILTDLMDGTDILLIDCPPIIIPDAAIMASKADGVLLIIQSGRVRYETAQKVAEQIRRSGGKLIGIVFNQLKSLDALSYTGYQYYSYQEPASPGIGSMLKKLLQTFAKHKNGDVPKSTSKSKDKTLQ